MKTQKFQVLGINRHRMKTDGRGITTLVALAGCPLSCSYCINKELLLQKGSVKEMSVEELIEELAIDHCYFTYTGGGVTFGGGESLLHSEQIAEFAKKCPTEWSVNLETSLNVPLEQLKPLVNSRFNFIIDVKAMQKDIYFSYTQRENQQVIENLAYIKSHLPKENYVIKVPLIPDYSTQEDVAESVSLLVEVGIPKENIVTFQYEKHHV